MIQEKYMQDIQQNKLFALTNDGRLSFDRYYDVADAKRRLARYVARYPLDLKAHTQRIVLAIDCEDRQSIPGCLRDLFIALGDKGKTLRSHLYRLASPYLTVKDRNDFEEWLEQGDAFGQKERWVSGSILSSDVQGLPLVVQLKSDEIVATPGYDNILEEARSCLEYGQIDEARILLEHALLMKLGDVEVEDELLNVYYYTQDAGSLNKMSYRIVDAGGTLSEAWLAMQSISKTWE